MVRRVAVVSTPCCFSPSLVGWATSLAHASLASNVHPPPPLFGSVLASSALSSLVWWVETLLMASPVVESLWRKPATRPQVALARAAATTGAVVVVWGLLRLGGVWPVPGSDVSRMFLGRGRAGIVTAPSDTALSVDGATSGGDDRPAVLTESPSAADLEGIRECKDAARKYMLTHLKDFHAENGAWGLKSALLALRGALVDAGPEAAAADNGPAAPLVVDVGANRGQNVPVWRAIYGEAAHLVLVEGNPAAARTLSTNFADKSDSVVVVQRLVGNSTAEMHFRVPKGETSLERAAIQAEESVGLFPDEFDYVVRSALCHWLPAAQGWSVGLIGRRLGRVFSGEVSSWGCLLTRTLVPPPSLPFPSSPHPITRPDWVACCFPLCGPLSSGTRRNFQSRPWTRSSPTLRLCPPGGWIRRGGTPLTFSKSTRRAGM